MPYISTDGKKLVTEEDAFLHALFEVGNSIINNDKLKKDFIDWFYSDNWVKKEPKLNAVHDKILGDFFKKGAM